MRRRGLCLVLAGPSGGGKSSVARALRQVEPALSVSISVTTRPARPAEREGVDYYFRTATEFEAMIAAGALLEWAQVLGKHLYGTPRAPVEQVLAGGADMVFDIDWQGFRSLRTAMPADVLGVFLLPPSLPALEARLRTRGGDTDAEIARRMDRAREEIAHCAEFDHVVVNDDFDRTAAAVRAILLAARTATARLIGLRDYCAALDRTRA
jgi:guanylate kinase